MKKLFLVFSLVLITFFLNGCQQLIFPHDYHVYIEILDDDKTINCDKEIIAKVRMLITNASKKYNYYRDRPLMMKNGHVVVADANDTITQELSCWYNSELNQKVIFFEHCTFEIEIRGYGSKKETDKLADELLVELKKSFPNYEFKDERKWVKKSILSH